MVRDDLDRVLTWRNHPKIRCYMFTTHEITIEEHYSWFESASKDVNKRLMIFEREGIPCGFVHFNNMYPAGIADWGFYTAPDAPKRTGKELGLAALKIGFEEVKLHKICGQALDFNVASIRFHKSLGFQQEGLLREQHYDGESYHSIICFGLLQSEWKNNFR